MGVGEWRRACGGNRRERAVPCMSRVPSACRVCLACRACLACRGWCVSQAWGWWVARDGVEGNTRMHSPRVESMCLYPSRLLHPLPNLPKPFPACYIPLTHHHPHTLPPPPPSSNHPSLQGLDCFHPSLTAHQDLAIGLWNDLICTKDPKTGVCPRQPFAPLMNVTCATPDSVLVTV